VLPEAQASGKEKMPAEAGSTQPEGNIARFSGLFDSAGRLQGLSDSGFVFVLASPGVQNAWLT
jgi:hypothetical protein